MKNLFSVRRTIAAKIGAAFGVIVLCVIGSSLYTAITLNSSKKISTDIITLYNPSSSAIGELQGLISNSKMLIKSWVYIDKKEGTPDKVRLENIHKIDFPKVKNQLDELSAGWDENSKKAIDTILVKTEKLFAMHQSQVMSKLNSFDSYQDMMITAEVQMLVDEGGDIIIATDNLLKQLDEVKQKFDNLQKTKSQSMITSFDVFSGVIYFIGLALAVIAIVAAYTTVMSIKRPINALRDFLSQLCKGIFPDNKVVVSNDEIGDMATALNTYIDSLKATAQFSKQIGEGNLDASFTPLSNQDVLGNSLLEMQHSLKIAGEEERKRKIEDDNRNWATEGSAKFGELLRQNNDDIEVLSYDIIKNMVQYLCANQGGLFILNDSDKDNLVLEMTACFAYDRHKFVERTIKVGEGLIGACFLEGQTIKLTDVPNSYMHITSGLGFENPKCIVIVPLKLNDVIFGVMEIASFEQMPKFKVEFIEHVAESIASTISSVKVNIRTAQLLEISQQQAEEMRAQEEEMRQNMEEMNATQEEMGRKTSEMQGLISALNASVYIMEFDINGKITTMNGEFSKILKVTLDQVRGHKHEEFVKFSGQDAFWKDLKSGLTKKRETHLNIAGKDIWLSETYTPIFDNNGDPIKVLDIAVDITQAKKSTNGGSK